MDGTALLPSILQLMQNFWKGSYAANQIYDFASNIKYGGTVSLKIILIHYFYSIKFVFFPFPLYIIVAHSFAKRLLKRNIKFSFFQYFVFGDHDFVKGDKSYSCIRA